MNLEHQTIPKQLLFYANCDNYDNYQGIIRKFVLDERLWCEGSTQQVNEIIRVGNHPDRNFLLTNESVSLQAEEVSKLARMLLLSDTNFVDYTLE